MPLQLMLQLVLVEGCQCHFVQIEVVEEVESHNHLSQAVVGKSLLCHLPVAVVVG